MRAKQKKFSWKENLSCVYQKFSYLIQPKLVVMTTLTSLFVGCLSPLDV